jgi:hypothetical protein
MIAMLALTVDGALLMDQRRRAQAAADAGALAGAVVLLNNTLYGTSKNPVSAAQTIAALNMPGSDPAVVNIPPQQSASYNGKSGYVEVTVSYSQPRGFSQIFGAGNITVSAHAVAAGFFSPLDDGIIVLDPSGAAALNVVGNSAIDVTSGPIIVDSSSPSAAAFNGPGSINASAISITGGYTDQKMAVNPTPLTGQPPVPDPLLWLPTPDPGSLTVQHSGGYIISGQTTITLSPGVYQGGISISGQANVTLNPGIYYMQGGGFTVNGNNKSIVTGNGVMIYNDGGGTISIGGQGTVNLSPQTGGMYTGITLYQSRSSTQPVLVSGNGSLTNISGTFYAAMAQPLQIAGNAGNIGSQYITYDLKVNGNGTLDATLESAPRPLVRVYGLVE